MYHALSVCVCERVCYFRRNAHGGLHWQLTLSANAQAERLSAHVRHEIVEQRLDVSRIVKRKDVRMLKARQQADFANETQLAGFRAGIRVQYLERNLALVPRVSREIDRRECALSDFAPDLVASRERRAQSRQVVPFDWCGQRLSPWKRQPGVTDLELRSADQRICTRNPGG